jgi:predicted DsbA family dithiol-disulfide isomerase
MLSAFLQKDLPLSKYMKIDVWSDVVCPWCFIGRRRLQKAISQHGAGHDITVRHRAFQLQPDITKTVPTSEHLATKYRIDKAEVAQMQANVCSIADGEGLCYKLENTLSGNTADAHRLILWAETIGKDDELLEALYSAYFEKSLPIFSHEDLLAITDQVGINHAAAAALLQSSEFVDRVQEDQAIASQLGANGVPFYVVDMKFGISGAQPQEVFNQIFAEINFSHSS